MNLADLVNFICTAAGYIEGDDTAACKTFVLARDRMIYDAALWKSSLVMVNIALDPTNNPDHAEGIVLLPEVVQRPVGVRTTENAVRVNAIEQYFRFDADKFAETGTPFEFAELSPVWVTWRGISAIPITCEAGDAALALRVAWRDGDVVKNTDLVLNANGVGTLAYITPDGDRIITINGAGDPLANGDYSFDVASSFWKNANDYLMSCDGAGWNIEVPDRSSIAYALDFGSSVWLGNGQFKSNDVGTTGPFPVPTSIFPDPTHVEIIAIYKPATTGPVSIGYGIGDGIVSNQILGTMEPAATVSPTFQRLRLFGIPSTAVTMKVLGKAKYQPLAFDQQEQTIRNSENCLIAFARGDVLRRGGENGAAQLAYQEAAALLQQLKDIEAVQAANNQRIIPDQGYGPEWGLGPYIRPYF